MRSLEPKHILGSSEYWGDKVCYLRLGFWRNVTRRKGEDGGLLKQSNVVIKNLYAIPSSLFVPAAPLWHCVYLRPLRDSVCLLYKTFSLSLHISEEPVNHPITISWIPCYHVSYYPVSCLPLPCYHVFYYPITTSLITLLSRLSLSCTMSSITLSPSRNAKPQKRVDKLIIPRRHTPQNN